MKLPPESIPATVTRGHRVASGGNKDPRFPGGTLAMQLPHFREHGLDLDGFFLSTLNLSIAPGRFEILQPKHTFREVNWHPTEPAEDFSFFDCWIRTGDGDEWIDGLIYYPHPETKPEHFQPPDLLEVIASRFIEGIDYGSVLDFRVSPDQIRLRNTESE